MPVCRLWVLMAVAFTLRLAFTLGTPAWKSADEYPHFWVAEQTKENEELPYYGPAFPRYEAFQPPLYYVTAAAMLAAVPGEADYQETPAFPPLPLLALRLLSVLLGVATVWIAYRTFAEVPTLRNGEPLWCAAFLAFLPTYVGITSSVSPAPRRSARAAARTETRRAGSERSRWGRRAPAGSPLRAP